MKTLIRWLLCLSVAFGCVLSWAQSVGKHNHRMQIDASGAVMHSNDSALPRGCTEISRDYEFSVRAGKRYAGDQPGLIYGMSQYELEVEPCSRIRLTFINEDQVRHQWMVHGLPRYLYPAGMFHIEAESGQTLTGSLIVPAENKTYLIHCDMAQHMEKGMRGQLVVGSGSGDLWDVTGVSDRLLRDTYLSAGWPSFVDIIAGLLGFGIVLLIWRNYES